MKLAAEFCLIGLAVHTNDVSGDDHTDNQAVEGSAGELINHYLTGISNFPAYLKYMSFDSFLLGRLLVFTREISKLPFQESTSQ